MNRRQQIRQAPRDNASSFLGALVGWFLSLCPSRKSKVTTADFERMDFRTSTQGLGLRFLDRIRNTFRLRWIRPVRHSEKDTRREDV